MLTSLTTEMLKYDQLERQSLDAFVKRVQQSAVQLLGEHAAKHEILQLCDDALERSEKALSNRGIKLPLLAVLGIKGQGKSWCTRSLVLEDAIRSRIPSGVLTKEATTKLYWIGPTPPSDLNTQHEVFFIADTTELVPLGFPYMLLDTPGSTDADEQAAKLAASATSIAPLVLLVSRCDQMAAAAVATLSHRAEGSIVIPVITAVTSEQVAAPESLSNRTRDESTVELVPSSPLQKQVSRWLANMQQSAASSTWLEPIYLEDFEESGNEALTANRFQAALRARLQSMDIPTITKTQDRRLNAIRRQLQEDVGQVLTRQVPSLANAVVDLHRRAQQIPEQAIEAIMGSRTQLLVAVRNQLRSQWVAETPAIFFPYRSVLSVLALTHGAWDRVVLALSGSLPSLFGSFAALTRNVVENRKFQNELKAGLQERIESQVLLLLQPIHEQFRHNLRHIRSSGNRGSSEQYDDATTRMRLTGVDQLQFRSAEIFSNVLESFRISSFASIVTGLIGTIAFWALFAGPIVGIYRDYLIASWKALSTQESVLLSFPAPSVSLMFTAIVLSVLPVMLFCMLAMTILLSRKRVVKVADRIAAEHRAMVQSLRSQGLLQLDIMDEELRNAQFLVDLEAT